MNCRTFQQALNDVFSRSWEQEQEAERSQDSAEQPHVGEPPTNNFLTL